MEATSWSSFLAFVVAPGMSQAVNFGSPVGGK